MECSEVKRKGIEDLINCGRSVDEIVEITEVSKSIVYEIIEDVNRKLKESESTVEDYELWKPTKAIVIIKNQLIKMAIEDKKYERGKALAEEIIENDKLSEKDKEKTRNLLEQIINLEKKQSKRKNGLIRRAIEKGDYETAKRIAQEILEDEGVSAEEKAIAKNQVIGIAIKKGDYARGKRLAKGIISDEEVPAETKAIAKNQLVTMAIKEKDYARGKELAQEILDAEEVSAEIKARVKSQLTTIAREEKDYVEAKKLAKEIIEDGEISAEEKAIAKSKLIKISIKEENYEVAKELAKEIIEDEGVSAEGKAIAKNQLIGIAIEKGDYETAKELAGEILDAEGVLAKTKLIAKDQLTECIRESLIYAGKISVDDIKHLVEEHSGTLRGCLLIAEAYKYFNAEELGKKWLTAYKRKNPDMPTADKKAIAGAMDILSIKNTVIPRERMKELWRGIYKKLDEATIESESIYPDDGGLR